MRQTERFYKTRRRHLYKAFKNEIENVWRKTVKFQLRSLDLCDFYDYYDFNYTISERAKKIFETILSGDYRASQPLIYRVEKKLGIGRDITVPHPTDALVLQVITENLYPQIIKKQPSKNAFYSRDKNINPGTIKAQLAEYGMSWPERWKQMQRLRYQFSKDKDLIIETDISNYFDSIDLTLLRDHVLQITTHNSNTLVDLLFQIIEDLSWKPDYLPYRKRGLPTINVDSVRLLGHCFLYDLDNYLKNVSKNTFTRWMDDITVGVDSKMQATKILNSASDIAKSQGLALNLSKTILYSPEKFWEDYMIEANEFLDYIEKSILFKSDFNRIKNKFRKHYNHRTPRYWTKITKRYLNLCGKNQINITKYLSDLYSDYPDLRKSISQYLSAIGPKKTSIKAISTILNSSVVRDDISLFYLCQTITNWDISARSPIIRELKKALLSVISNPYHFYCLLWISLKYDTSKEIVSNIKKYRPVWKQNNFVRRQVITTLARAYSTMKPEVEELFEAETNSSINDSESIISHLRQLATMKTLDSKLTLYLFPPTLKHYSLSRFLVLCSALNSEDIRKNAYIKSKIKSHINDKQMLNILKVEYDIT